MDEKKRILKLLDKIETKIDEKASNESKSKVSNPNLTNPIYKNLAKFSNAKIGDKWSIRDLLR